MESLDMSLLQRWHQGYIRNQELILAETQFKGIFRDHANHIAIERYMLPIFINAYKREYTKIENIYEHFQRAPEINHPATRRPHKLYLADSLINHLRVITGFAYEASYIYRDPKAVAELRQEDKAKRESSSLGAVFGAFYGLIDHGFNFPGLDIPADVHRYFLESTTKIQESLGYIKKNSSQILAYRLNNIMHKINRGKQPNTYKVLKEMYAILNQ